MANALTLSVAELSLLEALQETLLTPLDHPSVDDWRSTVNARVKELLQASVAVFALPPAADGAMCYSEELSDEVRTAFDAVHLADAGRERARSGGLEVWTQTRIIAGDWAGYHRDPAVNELLKPNDLLDAIGFAVDWPSGRREREFATLAAYSDRFGTELFSERGLRLLRLLLPAFKAGTRTVLQMAERQRALAGALDALGQALQVRSPNGRVLHETPSLGSLLAGDPHAQRLRDELARAAQAACAPVARRTKIGSDTLGDAAYRDVRTGVARYSVRAVAITGRVVDVGPVVLVALERVTPTPLTDAQLHLRYWLTVREIEVARLMAAGLSNPEIARRLGTSTHTARRHSERVLTKLAVHRRAEVSAKLHNR